LSKHKTNIQAQTINVTDTINNNGNYAAGLIYMYIYVYTGVLGNFRRVGEVGVFSCSDSVKMKQITHV
jgi:hypothetical protein